MKSNIRPFPASQELTKEICKMNNNKQQEICSSCNNNPAMVADCSFCLGTGTSSSVRNRLFNRRKEREENNIDISKESLISKPMTESLGEWPVDWLDVPIDIEPLNESNDENSHDYAKLISPNPPSVKNSHDEKWNQQYNDLCDFFSKHGHFIVPKTKNKALMHWSHTQRSIVKRFGVGADGMIQERFQALNAINFDWEPQQNEWNEHYQKLKEIFTFYGHCDFPTRSKSDGALSGWVASQRNYKKEGTLSKLKIKLLDEVSFKWSFSKEERLTSIGMRVSNYISVDGQPYSIETIKQCLSKRDYITYERYIKTKTTLNKSERGRIKRINHLLGDKAYWISLFSIKTEIKLRYYIVKFREKSLLENEFLHIKKMIELSIINRSQGLSAIAGFGDAIMTELIFWLKEDINLKRNCTVSDDELNTLINQLKIDAETPRDKAKTYSDGLTEAANQLWLLLNK